MTTAPRIPLPLLPPGWEIEQFTVLVAALDAAAARERRLVEALRPFAGIAERGWLMNEGDKDDQYWFRYDGDGLLVGDFRRARALLAEIDAAKGGPP